MTLLAVTLIVSYLVGAIPFGFLIARWRGVDIIHAGSGNIGATNVGRVLGRRFGILVFLLDFTKGALPVAAAMWIARRQEFDVSASWCADALPVGAGLAAFLGHLFPAYLRFHGGKGVATGAGVVSVLLPGPALGALIVWVALICCLRIVSLASLLAAVTLCVLRFGLTNEPLAADNVMLTLFCLVAAGLVIARHHANVIRLFQGTENQLQDTPTMRSFSKIIHVLAMGLWFGSVIFFTFVVGLTLFGTFQPMAEKDNRPIWFPLAREFNRDPKAWRETERTPFNTTKELRREQGSRAAGFAIGPMFDWYFLIQGACGLLTVATALSWSRKERGNRVHRLRTFVLMMALITVVIGWPLERRVDQLRNERNTAVDAVLKGKSGGTDFSSELDVLAKADEFASWHLCSLFLNFGTLALVTVGMALAAKLPPDQPPSPSSKNGGDQPC